ncbi:MAG: hypothetical protein QM785_10815 [Pyrinomonadaceae bacterium]
MIRDKRCKSIVAVVVMAAAFTPGCQSGNSPASETRRNEPATTSVAAETKTTANNAATHDSQSRVTWRERSNANKPSGGK